MAEIIRILYTCLQLINCDKSKKKTKKQTTYDIVRQNNSSKMVKCKNEPQGGKNTTFFHFAVL